jgi:hypothetical protein
MEYALSYMYTGKTTFPMEHCGEIFALLQFLRVNHEYKLKEYDSKKERKAQITKYMDMNPSESEDEGQEEVPKGDGKDPLGKQKKPPEEAAKGDSKIKIKKEKRSVSPSPVRDVGPRQRSPQPGPSSKFLLALRKARIRSVVGFTCFSIVVDNLCCRARLNLILITLFYVHR